MRMVNLDPCSLRQDLALMPLDDGFDNGKPQAAARISRGIAPTVEALKEMGQVCFREPDPGVLDPKHGGFAL
jgi:hypothetical protein